MIGHTKGHWHSPIDEAFKKRDFNLKDRLSTPIPANQKCAGCRHCFNEHSGYFGCMHLPICSCESFLTREI